MSERWNRQKGVRVELLATDELTNTQAALKAQLVARRKTFGSLNAILQILTRGRISPNSSAQTIKFHLTTRCRM